MVDLAPGVGLVDLQKGAVDADAAALAAHVAFALSPFHGFLNVGRAEEAEKGPPGLSGKSLPKGGAMPFCLRPSGNCVLSMLHRQGTSRKTVVGVRTSFRL
jgi:hypothetical protein